MNVRHRAALIGAGISAVVVFSISVGWTLRRPQVVRDSSGQPTPAQTPTAPMSVCAQGEGIFAHSEDNYSLCFDTSAWVVVGDETPPYGDPHRVRPSVRFGPVEMIARGGLGGIRFETWSESLQALVEEIERTSDAPRPRGPATVTTVAGRDALRVSEPLPEVFIRWSASEVMVVSMGSSEPSDVVRFNRLVASVR